MGDNFYAYIDAEETYNSKIFYESSVTGWRFTFEPIKIYDFYGYYDKNTFEKVTVKFKINNQAIDLATYIKEKLPHYKNDNLVVTKKYGYFLMGGYDSNYSYRAVGNGVDEIMVELFKKASLVSIDYDGKRLYYSTNGFAKAIAQCK
jgi:hypothetical protein